jgi:hypothetical protein
MISKIFTKASVKAGLIAGCASLALVTSPLVSDTAFAQQGSGNQMKGGNSAGSGRGASADQHGGGISGRGKGLSSIFKDMPGSGTNIETQIFRGKGERVIIIIEEDDDSDRPDWAGGSKELNPHRGEGNTSPGTTKGDLYGDLVYLLRDPVTGLPIEVDEGVYAACLDTACVTYEPIIDGEIPAGAIEVDFGRTNIMRAPDSVLQHSLDEVLLKLAAATTIETDEAGRLVLDGATIDSPLENLALYEALTSGEVSLDGYDSLLLATSALAGAADKTGTIDLDFLYNVNDISGINTGDLEYYDYSGFTYERDYDDAANGDEPYSYFYLDEDGNPVSASLYIDDYLASVNGELTDSTGATLFAAAADDALEVIELIHTQIHDEKLPGTIE